MACVVWRPLTVAGEIRSAPSARRTDWSVACALDVEPIDASLRAEVAEKWLTDAKLEHASVAAFAKLTLELMSL
jgi:hypothetical protein